MLGLQLIGGGQRRVVLLPSLSSEAAFQTIGRMELQLPEVRTISRQHIELSRSGGAGRS